MQEKDTREKLLESAALCFLEDDYKSVTTRKIAERAGVNSAMIAYYFQSKSNLFEAVIKHYFAGIYSALDVGYEFGLQEGMLTAWRKYYQVMTDQPELPRLMVRAMVYRDVPGHEHMVSHIIAKKMDTFCRHMREGQRQGLVRNDVSAKIAWIICASIAMTPVIFPDMVKQLVSDDLDTELNNIAETASKIIAKGLANTP